MGRPEPAVPRSPSRAGRAVVAVAVAVAILAACSTTSDEVTSSSASPPSATPVAVPGPPRLDHVSGHRAARSYAPAPAPTAVRIPAIGVASPLELLHRDAAGAIEVPSWQRAGWWAEGPRPGQRGPAVILGHVDSRSGPAVFFRLGELAVDDEVLVDRDDGSTVRFVVTGVERHAKEAFPTEAVYGATLEPGLRLVTCGGSFDRASGHYRDNVIVFAALAS